MHPRHRLLHLQCRVFQGLETIHLQQVREWVFLAQWQDPVTIPSMPLKEWRDLAPQDRAPRDLELDPKAELIVREQDLQAADHVQGLPARSQDLVAAHPEVDSLLEDQPEVAVEASVEEPPELLVKVEQEDRARLVSPSAQSAKNSNKEVFRALAALLCHAVTVQPSFDFVAVHRFRILQTRLMLTPVS
jgi:hypothetical protein